MASILKALDELDILPETDVHPMNRSKVGAALGTLEPEGKTDIMSALDIIEGIEAKPSRPSVTLSAPEKVYDYLADLDAAMKSGMAAGAATLFAIPENVLSIFSKGVELTGLHESLGLVSPGESLEAYRPDIGWLRKMREQAEKDAAYWRKEGFVPEVVAGLAQAPAGIVEFGPGKVGIFYAMIRGYMEEGLEGMFKGGALRGLWGYGLKAGAPKLAPGMPKIAKELRLPEGAADLRMLRGASKKMLGMTMALASGVESAIGGADVTQTTSAMTVMAVLGVMAGGKGAKRTRANDIRVKMAEDAMKRDDIGEASKQLENVAKSQPEVISEASAMLAEKFKNIKGDIETLMEQARTPEQRQAAIDKVMPTKLEDTLKLKAQARQAEINRVMAEVLPEKAPEISKGVKPVESTMGRIDRLVSEIKSFGEEIGYKPGLAKDKLQIPVGERKPADTRLIEQENRIQSVLNEIEKLEGLRDVAEKATGMNLKSLYDKAIDDAIATLPVGEKIELQSAISGFRKEVHFTDLESYKARKVKEAKETKEAEKQVDKKADKLKALATDLYKGDVDALSRLKKAVEEHGLEDVSQAVRSTYTEGDTPGYRKLRPEIDKILEPKPEVGRRKRPEFREQIAKEIKEMEVAKAKGETVETKAARLSKTTKEFIQTIKDKDMLDRYKEIFGKDVVDSILKVEPKIVKPEPVPEVKPKVEPKPKPKPKEPLNETERLMAELDGLAPKHLVRRAKELGLEQTVWSKVYANPEFVKRQIISKELKAPEVKPTPEVKAELTPELKAEARTVFEEIIKKPELSKEDVKWLRENRDVLGLSEAETLAIKVKMVSSLVKPGLFGTEAEYKKSIDNVGRYFKGEKPYGEKLYTGIGIDPALVKDVAKIMRYHIGQGVKGFYQVSQKIIKDLEGRLGKTGGDKVRPYLKPAWDAVQTEMSKVGETNKAIVFYTDGLNKYGSDRVVGKSTSREVQITEGIENMLKQTIGKPNVKISAFITSIFNFEKIDGALGTNFKDTIFRQFNISKKMRIIDHESMMKDVLNMVEGIRPGMAKVKKLSSDQIRNMTAYAYAQQKGGKEVLDGMRVKYPSKLEGRELELYDKIGAYNKDLYIRLNEARKFAGQKPLKEVDNYFTFMRVIERMMMENINPVMSRPSVFQARYETPFPYDKIRRRSEIPLELNGIKVFRIYSDYALKYIYTTPVLVNSEGIINYRFPSGKTTKEGKPITTSLAETNPGAFGYLSRWLQYESGARPPMEMLGSHRMYKYIHKLRTNVIVATLGGNLRTIANQIPAFLETANVVSPRSVALGALDYLNPAMRKFARDTSDIMIVRTPPDVAFVDTMAALMLREGHISTEVGMKKYIESLGAGARGLQRYSLKGVEVADTFSATISWLAAFREGKTRGMDAKRAKEFADDVVLKIQASADSAHIAQIQKDNWGRILTTFNTFSINRYSFLKRDVVGKLFNRDTDINARITALGLIIRYALINAIISSVYNDIFGVTPPNPAPIDAARFAEEGSEAVDFVKEALTIVPIIGYGGRYPGSFLGPVAGLGYDASRLLGDMKKPENFDYAKAVEVVARGVGVPATTQIAGTIRRAKQDRPFQQILFSGEKRAPGLVGDIFE